VNTPIRRIVVGLDGSEDARRAASWAAALARAVDAEVIAVHGLGLLERLESGETVGSDTHRATIRALFDGRWCAPLRESGARFRTELREGNPVTALLTALEDLDADLLVVGSRGAGELPTQLLGSTSTQVAQHARCPVVIVPSPMHHD